MEIYQI